MPRGPPRDDTAEYEYDDGHEDQPDELDPKTFKKQLLSSMSALIGTHNSLSKRAPRGSRINTLVICSCDTVETKDGEDVLVQDGLKVVSSDGAMQVLALACMGQSVPLCQIDAYQRKTIANFIDIVRGQHRNGMRPEPQRPMQRMPVNNHKKDLQMVRHMLRLELNAFWGKLMHLLMHVLNSFADAHA
jgi:hypothetical protein